MDQQAKRTIAYLCPACHQSVAVERSVFQLAASATHLPCPCGKSAVEVEMMGDQVRLTVPCRFCGRSHTVICPSHVFLHQCLLGFSCAASGLDCCYVGEEEAVLGALSRLEAAADKLPGEKEENGAFLDPMVMEEVLGELKEIAARDGISCTCGSHRWKLRIGYSNVELTCADCGGTMRLPAATSGDIDDICCKTKLVIRGREGEEG